MIEEAREEYPVFSSTDVCLAAWSWSVPLNQKLTFQLAWLARKPPKFWGHRNTQPCLFFFYIGIQLGIQTQIIVLAESALLAWTPGFSWLFSFETRFCSTSQGRPELTAVLWPLPLKLGSQCESPGLPVHLVSLPL